MKTVYDRNGNAAIWQPNMAGEWFNELPVRATKEYGMKTLYLKDGTEIKRDGVDARDYVRAGLATYENPTRVEIVTKPVEIQVLPSNIVEQVANVVHRRGRPSKGDKDGMQEEK